MTQAAFLSTVVDLREGPGGPPLFWVKIEEITEGREEKTAGQAKQNRPTPLNLRSGSATGQLSRDKSLELTILLNYKFTYEMTSNKSEIFYLLTVNFFLVSLNFSNHALLNVKFFVVYCYAHLAEWETKKQ